MPERPAASLPRVLFAIGGLGAGGSESQLCSLIARIHGVEVDAVVVVGVADPGPRLDRLRALGVPVYEVGWTRGLRPKRLLRLGWRHLQVLRAERPDVIYAWLEEMSILLVPLAKIRRVPVVVARRNISGAMIESRRWLGRLIRRVERHADLVTGNSKAVLAEAERRGIPARKLLLIPNALDPRPYVPPPDVYPVRLGYLARMRAEKGHHRLLGVLCRLPENQDWSARLGGDGPLQDDIHAEAERLGILDRIEFCGNITDAGEFWDSCDVALLLSDHEGSPNSLLEAARAGRPLLATAVGGTIEIVVPGTGFLVAPDATDEAASRLRDLIADPELRATLGAHAREEVLRNHDPEQVTALHLEALFRAVG